MVPNFTKRQGEYLAFIERYTARKGVAPSFAEIGSHFGATPPSVNGMIKTLERRGLLSRAPGVARSLRVLIPASSLTGGDYGSRPRRGDAPAAPGGGLTPVDSAATAAIAVLDALMPALMAAGGGAGLVAKAASAAGVALIEAGLDAEQARQAAARLAAEEARWRADGRGTIVRRRCWVSRKRRG